MGFEEVHKCEIPPTVILSEAKARYRFSAIASAGGSYAKRTGQLVPSVSMIGFAGGIFACAQNDEVGCGECSNQWERLTGDISLWLSMSTGTEHTDLEARFIAPKMVPGVEAAIQGVGNPLRGIAMEQRQGWPTFAAAHHPRAYYAVYAAQLVDELFDARVADLVVAGRAVSGGVHEIPEGAPVGRSQRLFGIPYTPRLADDMPDASK
jgi:hypothetical protein